MSRKNKKISQMLPPNTTPHKMRSTSGSSGLLVMIVQIASKMLTTPTTIKPVLKGIQGWAIKSWDWSLEEEDLFLDMVFP